MPLRRFLLLSVALALAEPAACAAIPGGWENIDLDGLNEIRSENGRVSATLHAAPAEIDVGRSHFTAWAYNGSYAGPVLRARPGDTVQIDLDNALPEPTNLHFHGLRVSPQDRGDNMHVVVMPGASRRYSFRIPANHPPGLFWFHDHIHGLTEKHVTAGLSGTILIDGFARQFGGLEGIKQKLLVLKDFDQPGCIDPFSKAVLHCRLITVNGHAPWTNTLQTGQAQLWRIANEGADYIIHVAAPGLRMRIIGRDGLPVMAAEPAEVLDILPASRMDVLVSASTPGTIGIEALHVPTGAGQAFTADRQIGTVTVTGQPDTADGTKPTFPAQRDLRSLTINKSRTVVFSEDADALRYFIDGKLFAHDRIDIRVPLGTIEEWTVQNRTQDFHEFHIHQLGFQVIEINGVRQIFDGFVDDVKVPEMGEVKLLLPFTDPVIVGRFMFHCHVLKHEDGGMMANIEVYRPDESWIAPICHSALSGVAVPSPQTDVTPDMLNSAAQVLQGLNN